MDDPKQIARRVFLQTLASIDISLTMERHVSRSGNCFRFDDRSYDLSKFSEIKVVALGKATHAMLAGFAQLFGDRTFSGVAVAPTAPVQPICGITYFLGGHPLPNEHSFRAAQATLELLRKTSATSLVVFLISGGGSALIELPLHPSITLEDVRSLNQMLVTCGASIDEINTIRKHVSAIKGGRLATAAPLATKLTLAVSDVPLGKESSLASGPTIPDPTTVADARRILAQYKLSERLPGTVSRLFAAGTCETPKSAHHAFPNSQFSLLLTSHDLFHAAHHAAESEGFLTCCDNSTDDWPLDRAADYLFNQLADLRRQNPGQRVALIANGELSSKVAGQGIGGRNSAFVLVCVEQIAGQPITVLSAGTDGVDGNSPAAGAVADGNTLARAKQLGLIPTDFFAQSDSYNFFRQLDDAILTGPTGNNLRDLRILLAFPS